MKDKSKNDSTRRKKSFNNSLIRARILKLTNLKEKFEIFLKNVKKSQIKYYNKRHNSQFYKIKDRILLSFKNIIFNRFLKQLDFKFYESYEITNFVKKNDISTDSTQNISVSKYSRRFSCFIAQIVYKQTQYRFEVIRHWDEKKETMKNRIDSWWSNSSKKETISC